MRSTANTENKNDALSISEQALRQRIAQSLEVDTLNRALPNDVEPNRHVVVVVGVTGGGKSSTANTLRHSNRNSFQVSSSITSVTQSIGYRDYSFDPGGTLGQKVQLSKIHFRVIDTPGLQDTNQRSVEQELEKLQALAPHGVSAFLVCVPMGRVTPEHEAVLENLVVLFGPHFSQHSVVVVTSARVKPNPRQPPMLLNRNELQEQMGKLPSKHFLRQFVEQAGHRLVGVENVLEPYRTQSALRLHQAVLDTVAANGGKRYQFMEKKELRDEEDDKTLVLQKVVDGYSRSKNVTCRQEVSSVNGDTTKVLLTVQCEIDLSDSSK